MGGSSDFEIRSGFGIEVMLLPQMVSQCRTDPDVVELHGQNGKEKHNQSKEKAQPITGRHHYLRQRKRKFITWHKKGTNCHSLMIYGRALIHTLCRGVRGPICVVTDLCFMGTQKTRWGWGLESNLFQWHSNSEKNFNPPKQCAIMQSAQVNLRGNSHVFVEEIHESKFISIKNNLEQHEEDNWSPGEKVVDPCPILRLQSTLQTNHRCWIEEKNTFFTWHVNM